MKRSMRVWAAALMLSIPPAVAVVAQEAWQYDPKAADIIKSGEYRDLTWLRQVKLGTAPFVNPVLYEKAAVAFKYDAKAMRDVAGWDKLKAELAAGELGVATVEDGQYRVMMTVLEDFDMLSERIAAEPAAFVFMSTQQKHLGLDNAGAVVSWDAGPPIHRSKD